jgi:hypothetical protein
MALDPLSAGRLQFTFINDRPDQQYDWQITAAYGERVTP